MSTSSSSSGGTGTTVSPEGDTTQGSSTGLTTSGGTLDVPAAVVLLDLFEDCALAQWQSFDIETGFSDASCENDERTLHELGGGWRYSTLDSPQFGMQQDVLILRPFPGNDGLVTATFNAGAAGIEQNAILQFDYEFINTLGDDETSRMGFQA